MKKSIVSIILLFICVLTLPSCTAYSSKAGTKKDMVGTYELTTITKKDENDNKYDYKKAKGIQALFSIDENGYGYYAYKDNDTPLKLTTIFSKQNSDYDEPELYDSIDLTDGYSHKYTWEKEVGCMDEPTMGFNKNLHTFSYTILHNSPSTLVKHEIPYQYVCYTRISKNAGLSAINDYFHSSFTETKPFEMNRLDGLYIGSFNNDSPDEHPNPNADKYDYVILDCDSYSNATLKLYYALKDDHIKHEITIPVNIVPSYNGYNVMQTEIFGLTFECSGYGDNLGTGLSHSVLSEEDASGTRWYYYSDYFGKYYGSATTVDELIDQLTTPAV